MHAVAVGRTDIQAAIRPGPTDLELSGWGPRAEDLRLTPWPGPPGLLFCLYPGFALHNFALTEGLGARAVWTPELKACVYSRSRGDASFMQCCMGPRLHA